MKTIDRIIRLGAKYHATPSPVMTKMWFVRKLWLRTSDPEGWSIWFPWFFVCKFGNAKYIRTNQGHRFAISFPSAGKTYRFF